MRRYSVWRARSGVHRVARKRSTGSTSFAGGMELPVLHIAISRGFSSNVLLIRMTPLSHRRFSAARVVNQHAVHEARSKVATAVPNFFATNRLRFTCRRNRDGRREGTSEDIIVACPEDSPNAPVFKNKRAAEGAPSLAHQSRQSRESADEG
jgi:hypothetical protein